MSNMSPRPPVSRLPTTDADGNVIGYLHLKDVLEDDERAPQSPVPAERRRPCSDSTHRAFAGGCLDAGDGVAHRSAAR
jgi:hypothetical protein